MLYCYYNQGKYIVGKGDSDAGMKIIQLTNMTLMQSMGYVIKANSGEVIVIDGGAPG